MPERERSLSGCATFAGLRLRKPTQIHFSESVRPEMPPQVAGDLLWALLEWFVCRSALRRSLRRLAQSYLFKFGVFARMGRAEMRGGECR